MGHRDYKTTLIYADYAPRSEERQMIERAFATGGDNTQPWTAQSRGMPRP
jgi:hypothetical protein